jgi:hypothetical protein
MVADQKIKEAEYFFDKITRATTREDFVPNLSAFLSATRSIPDYLLQDYNVKLGLNISIAKKLYPRTFRRRAIKERNLIARNFIQEYNSLLNSIYENPIGKLLTKKRNISIHRTDVPVRAGFKRKFEEIISFDDSVSIEVRDKHGHLKMRSGPIKQNVKSKVQTDEESVPPDSVKWYFDDYQNDDVVISCEKFLGLVKSFVATLSDKYT